MGPGRRARPVPGRSRPAGRSRWQGDISWRCVVYTSIGRIWNARSNTSDRRARPGVQSADGSMSTDIFNAASCFIDRHLDDGRADAVAIECGDRRVSYAALCDAVNRTGRALRDTLGVRPEERVLLLMLDVPEMVFACFGAIKIGAIPVPTNTMWTSDDYEFVLRDSRAVAVIVSAPLYPRLATAVSNCPWIRHVVVAGGAAGDGAIDFDALIAS